VTKVDSQRVHIVRLMSPLVEKIRQLDERATHFVQHIELGIFETLIAPGGALFGWEGTVGVIMPILYYLYGRQGLYYHICTTTFAQVISRFMKQTIRRARPTVPDPTPRRFFATLNKHLLETVHDPECKDGASFPSGDTMSGGALGGMLCVITNSWWPLFVPVWVGFGRQYYFCHWFLDTLFGGLNGVMAALIMNRVFGSYKNIQERHVLASIVLFLLAMKTSTIITNQLHERWQK